MLKFLKTHKLVLLIGILTLALASAAVLRTTDSVFAQKISGNGLINVKLAPTNISNIEWRLDTSSSVVELQYDKNTDKFTFIRFISKSAEDASLGLSDYDLYVKLLNENVRKNQAFDVIKSRVANVTISGNITSFNPSLYYWRYDVNRVLVVNLSAFGLSVSQINRIQNDCDTRFGAGLVKIQ